MIDSIMCMISLIFSLNILFTFSLLIMKSNKSPKFTNTDSSSVLTSSSLFSSIILVDFNYIFAIISTEPYTKRKIYKVFIT